MVTPSDRDRILAALDRRAKGMREAEAKDDPYAILAAATDYLRGACKLIDRYLSEDAGDWPLIHLQDVAAYTLQVADKVAVEIRDEVE